MTFSQIVVQFFSILTVVAQILIPVMIISMFSLKRIRKAIIDNYTVFVLVVSGIATFGSLVFSLILGFAPCELCWYQRIFMYPITIISFVALLKNDKKIAKYVMPLAIIGALIALYHTLLQIFPEVLQCTDEVAKCSTKQFAFLGYVTIPVMALTAFVMIILATVIVIRGKK